MDGVKLMANGIRLEKQIIKKENPAGKSTKKRSVTHDTTNIGKDADADVIIDATKGKGKKKKSDKDESSVDRTEEEDTEKESDDTEKESDN